jgi:hypothetical protein
LNPFAPPDNPNAESPPPRPTLADRLRSLRFQAFLCFAAAAFALFTGRGEHLYLRYAVAVLGVACGVQCIWRDSKRRNSRFFGRRL